jgi:hypothetical protein
MGSVERGRAKAGRHHVAGAEERFLITYPRAAAAGELYPFEFVIAYDEKTSTAQG